MDEEEKTGEEDATVATAGVSVESGKEETGSDDEALELVADAALERTDNIEAASKSTISVDMEPERDPLEADVGSSSKLRYEPADSVGTSVDNAKVTAAVAAPWAAACARDEREDQAEETVEDVGAEELTQLEGEDNVIAARGMPDDSEAE